MGNKELTLALIKRTEGKLQFSSWEGRIILHKTAQRCVANRVMKLCQLSVNGFVHNGSDTRIVKRECSVLCMTQYSLVQKKGSVLHVPSHLWSCVRAHRCRTSVSASPWMTTCSSLWTARWTPRTPSALHTCLRAATEFITNGTKA